ncbi:hypothetical protein [Zhihengliuella salsuginis]|uniref:Uncharacterized protein n=1 Tax=Zhihengliuella salsuginis TaxID=578222 RepID=A0ABQ3GDJ1_9MICC|nr:hypothetical protein [Zhihengliuella salsuginis]GHD00570.1 hypothetical protein GCM10008096_04040 [Zhihengliuella salsuginis]
MKIRQLVTLAAAAVAALLLASCSQAESPAVETPSGTGDPAAGSSPSPTGGTGGQIPTEPDPLASAGPPECTAEALPFKIGKPTGTDDEATTRRFDFGPTTADCTLSQQFDVAFLDDSEDVIGAPAAFAAETPFSPLTVETGQFVSVDVRIRETGTIDPAACEPVESTYVGWRLAGDAAYALGDQAGDGRVACASAEHELLEVGPYRIQ